MNSYWIFTLFVIIWLLLCKFYFDSKNRTNNTAGTDFIALMIGFISGIMWMLVTGHYIIVWLWN